MEKKITFIGWLKYLKRKNAKGKNFVKPDVISSVCDHLWRWYPDRPDDVKCQRCGKVQIWEQTVL